MASGRGEAVPQSEPITCWIGAGTSYGQTVPLIFPDHRSPHPRENIRIPFPWSTGSIASIRQTAARRRRRCEPTLPFPTHGIPSLYILPLHSLGIAGSEKKASSVSNVHCLALSFYLSLSSLTLVYLDAFVASGPSFCLNCLHCFVLSGIRRHTPSASHIPL